MTDKTVNLPVDIAVFPYLQDHHFEGNSVYPGVEAMQVLAKAVKEFAPETDISFSTDTVFDKFLFIPPGTKKMDALCCITLFENGDITAVLQTKTRVKKATFTRIKEHVTVHFPRLRPELDAYRTDPLSFGKRRCLEISPDQIYREFVPLGPSYQNISDSLSLHKDGVLAKLHAPIIGNAIKEPTQLGSPFVLDAAFHSACVWGQCYRGVVSFPVGIEKRLIVRPTRPGGTYISTAIPVRTDPDMLIFDICICNEDNTLYEIALGVHMRDVSAGRMKPPAWIIKGKAKI